MRTQELIDDVGVCLGQAQHFLGIAAYDTESAAAGAQRRAVEAAPLPGMVGVHRDAAAEAHQALQQGDNSVRRAYSGALALTRSPHLSEENHDWVIATLTSVVETMVATGKGAPHLDAGTTHLFAANNPACDPQRVNEQLNRASDELGLAVPHLALAAQLVDDAAARQAPTRGPDQTESLARSQIRQDMAAPSLAHTARHGPSR